MEIVGVTACAPLATVSAKSFPELPPRPAQVSV
jgi:hypothetical protein